MKGNADTLDKQETAKYMKMAADNGNADAMNYYAQMLENGDGIPIDYKEASK